MSFLGTDPLDKDPDDLGFKEYRELAKRLSIEEEEVENEDLIEVVDKVASVSPNAKTVLRKFRIVDDNGIFEHVESDNRAEGTITATQSLIENGRFIHRFLTSKKLNESIGGLNTENGFSGWHWNKDHEDETNDDRELDWYQPVFVDGYIAWLMIRGGAYDSFDGTQAEAKEWGRQFETELFDENYEDFFARRINNKQWSEWFDITQHWDDTLVIANVKEKRIWLFMFTATD